MYSWRPNLGFCTAYLSIQPLRYATSSLELGLKSPSFDFELKNFLCVFPKLSFIYKILGVRLRGFGQSAGGEGTDLWLLPYYLLEKLPFFYLLLFYPCDNQWSYSYMPVSGLASLHHWSIFLSLHQHHRVNYSFYQFVVIDSFLLKNYFL